MSTDPRAFLGRLIYQTAHITGEFTLRSGAKSTEYFDKYLFEADPKLLKAIAEAMVRLVPSGGVSSANAREFLHFGAFAVSAGTEVVPPASVAAGEHADIARRAAHFVASMLGRPHEG